MPRHPKLSLIEHFQDLSDPRVNRTQEPDLIDLLVIAVFPRLCAGEADIDMVDFGHAKQRFHFAFRV